MFTSSDIKSAFISAPLTTGSQLTAGAPGIQTCPSVPRPLLQLPVWDSQYSQTRWDMNSSSEMWVSSHLDLSQTPPQRGVREAPGRLLNRLDINELRARRPDRVMSVYGMPFAWFAQQLI